MIAWYLSRPAFQAQMTLCIGPGGSRHWLVRFIVMIWCLKCVCLTFTLCTGSQRPSLCPKQTCSDLLFISAQFYHRWYAGPCFFIFVPFGANHTCQGVLQVAQCYHRWYAGPTHVPLRHIVTPNKLGAGPQHTVAAAILGFRHCHVAFWWHSVDPVCPVPQQL